MKARIAGLVVVIFATAAAWWHFRTAGSVPANTPALETPVVLSDGTRSVLHGVKSPVEVRFFCMLDDAGAPAGLRSFAGRVDKLLAEYERESGGKLNVTRITTRSTTNENAALAAGIRPTELDKGDGDYLGIAVLDGQQKESLVQVSQQWEPALEADLSRAIASAGIIAAAPVPSSAIASTADTAAIKDLINTHPQLAAATLDQGTQMLRNEALTDFATVVKDMQAQLQVAQQQYKDSESANSEAAQAAAREQIRQIPAAQTEKLAGIGTRLTRQINAFQQYRSTTQ